MELNPILKGIMHGVLQQPKYIHILQSHLDGNKILLKETPVMRSFVTWMSELVARAPKTTSAELHVHLETSSMSPIHKTYIHTLLQNPVAPMDRQSFVNLVRHSVDIATHMQFGLMLQETQEQFKHVRMDQAQAFASEIAHKFSQLARQGSVVNTSPISILDDLSSHEIIMSTGISFLDEALTFEGESRGGIRKGAPIIIGAPSNNGKTTVTVHFAAQGVRQKVRTCITETETSQQLFVIFILMNLTESLKSEVEWFVGNRVLNNPHASEESVKAAREMVNPLHEPSAQKKELMEIWLQEMQKYLVIHPAPRAKDEMNALINAEMLENTRLIILDHIGGVGTGDMKGISEHVFYGSMVKDLIHLCTENGAGVVIFGQLDPVTESNVRAGNTITNFAFRHSKEIYHHGDVVLGLRRDPNTPDVTQFEVFKNRHRSEYDAWSMDFDKMTKRFYVGMHTHRIDGMLGAQEE